MMAETAQQSSNSQPEGRARRGWIGRTARAISFGLTDADTIVVAAAGFLLRGGLLLLLVPSVVLPSVIGVASVTGVGAFGIDGHPTTWLFEVAVVVTVIGAGWLLLAFLLGSLVDVWLIEAAFGDERRVAREPRPLPDLRLLLDLAAIRSVLVLPLAGALMWAVSRIYSVAYVELTVPTNLASPLVLRVILGASDAVLVVVLAWLATEVVGAIAVRRLVLLGDGVWRSIGGAIMQIARKPIASVGTVIFSFGASSVAVGLAMAATATAFDWCRVASQNQHPWPIAMGRLQAIGDIRPIVFILAAIALGAAWVVALALSGVASAWRSAAFTGETAATVPEARTGSAGNLLGLSGVAPERSGD
jgi:hypothetical protein